MQSRCGYVIPAVVSPLRAADDAEFPELAPEHPAEQLHHGLQPQRQPLVRLLEGEHEHVDVHQVVLQEVHQLLDARLLLLQAGGNKYSSNSENVY